MAQIVDLFEVVSELEAFAARLAATRATDAQMAAIQIAHDQCGFLARTGDARDYFEANNVFHSAIWAATNNQALIEQIRAADKRLTPYRRQITFYPRRKQDSPSEHKQIAEALALRQPDIAQSAMRDHVMILADDALQMARDLRL
ncbi:GntR family transcriptional regulator [Ruegeria halocynthiae]|nr:FCD domain-containing protein [Ruegeria halocynthiae]